MFTIGCSSCGGEDQSCEDCGGSGVKDIYRCPSSFLSQARADQAVHVDLLIRAYLHYDLRHVLPVKWGLMDQSRSFLAACDILDGERGRLEEMKQEKRDRDARKAQEQAKRSRSGR